MAKKKTPKRLTRSERTRIISIANTEGLTAGQVEKRFGISKWTYYGWRKRSSGMAMRRVGKSSREMKGGAISTRALREEIRSLLPSMVRDEVTRTLANLVARTGRGRR